MRTDGREFLYDPAQPAGVGASADDFCVPPPANAGFRPRGAAVPPGPATPGEMEAGDSPRVTRASERNMSATPTPPRTPAPEVADLKRAILNEIKDDAEAAVNAEENFLRRLRSFYDFLAPERAIEALQRELGTSTDLVGLDEKLARIAALREVEGPCKLAIERHLRVFWTTEVLPAGRRLAKKFREKLAEVRALADAERNRAMQRFGALSVPVGLNVSAAFDALDAQLKTFDENLNRGEIESHLLLGELTNFVRGFAG